MKCSYHSYAKCVAAGLAMIAAGTCTRGAELIPQAAETADRNRNAEIEAHRRLTDVFQRAGNGDADAQLMLGRYYEEGHPLVKDSVESAKWYRKAADQGCAEAQFALGCDYLKGVGVEKDPGTAVKWFLQAAGRGSERAMLRLGLCYRNGEGVPNDDIEALAWFILASGPHEDWTADPEVGDPGGPKSGWRLFVSDDSALDSQIAVKARNRLAKEVGPERTAQGKKRCEELKKEIEATKAAKAEAETKAKAGK